MTKLMSCKRKTFCQTAITSFVALAVSLPLTAQDLILEEIIVTAQKREESLNDAPVTVNFIGGDALRDASIFGADELSKMTAGIEVRWEGDSNTGVGIRGVGTFSQQSAPPRVASYIDDHFMGSQAAFAFASMFDMKQVQVLRGPQGTLYGQPSPTGALILETNNPNMEKIEGYVRGSVQDPSGHHLEGAVSLPIIKDKLALRVAVLKDERETGVKLLTRGGNEERNRDGVRAKLEWHPTDNISARLAYTAMESNGSDTYRAVESLTPTAAFQLTADDRTSIEDAPGQTIFTNDNMLNFHLDWSFDWGDFSLYAGNYWNERDTQNDNDRTDQQLAALLLGGKFDHQTQFEPKLSFNVTDSWSTTIGAFYQDTEAQTDVNVNQHIIGTGVFQIILDIPSASTTSAIYTHNTFELSEATTLTLGVRYNEFDNSSSNIINGNFALGSVLEPGGNVTDPIVLLEGVFPCVPGTGIGPNGGAPCVAAVAEKINKVTGTIKLAHSFSDALNMYVTVDRGFRPGAPNFDTTGGFQATPEDPTSDQNSYQGESVDSVEIGAKGTLFGGRAQYGAAIFYSIYEDYQINPVFEVYNGVTGAVSIPNSGPYVNVAEAVQAGIEGEIRMLVSENIDLFASATYAQVEFTDGLIPCTNPALGALDEFNRFNECEADGQVASPQPELFVTIDAEYHRQFGENEWYLKGLFNYRGDSEAPGDPTKRFSTDAYSQLDVFAGIRAESWDMQLYVKNIADDDGVSSRRSTTVPDYNQLTVIPPRTVGLTASYRF